MASCCEIKNPVYFQRDYDRDARTDLGEPSLILRIAIAVLPFFALYQPFGKLIAISTDGSRSYNSFKAAIAAYNSGNFSKEVLKTTLAVIALSSSVFMHPLGLFITTFSDLIQDVNLSYENGEIFSSLNLKTLHTFLYLIVMMYGSLEIISLSLLIQIIIEIIRTREEYNKGNHNIEMISHLLMAVVRVFQEIPNLGKLADKWDSRQRSL